MKKTINLHEFQDAFKAIRPENFTNMALEAMFEYFEQYEQDTGDEMEMDVIAICCEYTEYGDLEEYGKDYEPVDSLDEIRNKTAVIEIPGTTGFIIQQY